MMHQRKGNENGTKACQYATKMLCSRLLIAIALTWIFGAMCAESARAQSWSNGYAFRSALTISHTNVPNTDQANFPVLISGTYSFLATTANGGDVTSSNGYDIIFTSDSAGTSVLPFERESYSGSTGSVIFWVQVPTLSHTTDTVIYVFYGNGAVTTDQSNKTGVWDSNYVGVWHLANGTTLSASDSTSNGNNGTVHSAAATGGEIDGAASFNGSSQYIDMGNGSSLQITGNTITVEAWLYTSVSNPSAWQRIIVKETAGNADPYTAIGLLRYAGTNNLEWAIGTGGAGSGVGVESASALQMSTWTHVVGTYDGSHLNLYLNGTLNAQSSASGNIVSTNQDMVIGADTADNQEYFGGDLDEVRISNSTRSADWIATEYSNQSNPSNFFSMGSPVVNGLGGSGTPYIQEVGPSSGPILTELSILGANFGTTQGSSTVTFNGTSAAPASSWTNSSILVQVPSTATSGPVLVNVSGTSSNSATFTVTTAPIVSNLSVFSGAVGIQVGIYGANFGTSGTVTLNGLSCSIVSWTTSLITVVVPSGASSGPFVVTTGGQTATSTTFTVTVLPADWQDLDIGQVGLTGSASYANGVFTASSAGTDFTSGQTSDAFHMVYQPLAGDGAIVARVASIGWGYLQAGVMIRESLNANARNAFLTTYTQNMYFCIRTSTGGTESCQTFTEDPNLPTFSVAIPYWVKVARSGNVFTSYIALDGVNWVQVATSETISMAQNVYIGLATSSDTTSTLYAATFDGVSVTSSLNADPIISGVSATEMPVGGQVTITGSNFGASQGSSAVLLNDTAATVSSWSATSITFTVPSGASSGALVVSVAPTMNDSNAVDFTVTSSPLPTGWLDQDVGQVPTEGSAGYASGVFTVAGSGCGVGLLCGYGGAPIPDEFHFAYQPLSGDGTIVARVVSSSLSGEQAGVMIRETLDPNAKTVFVSDNSGEVYAWYRTLYGAGPNYVNNSISAPLPYWLKLVRMGNSFNAYQSPDGNSWTSVGGTLEVEMGSNVYIGLGVGGGVPNLNTATFDNVSVSSTATPAPAISGLSATTGSVGSQVVISGSGFGASQGSSVVFLNDTAMTVSSWSATSITITIASGATSGLMNVVVGPDMDSSNGVFFAVTSSPLPSGWFDTDIGAVGVAGNASYSSGVFTVQGAGASVGGSADAFHFVYQPLLSDGTVIARVVTQSTNSQVGVMIRETLNASSTEVYSYLQSSGSSTNNYMNARTSIGGTTALGGGTSVTVPQLLEVVRTGNTFFCYEYNGSAWTQIGTTQTFATAQEVYVGFGVSSGTTSSLATATFDTVSVTAGSSLPNPTITGITPNTGAPGAAVTISGSGFGTTQTTSTITFNGAAATPSSWSDTQIVASVPDNTTSGPVTVTVGNITGAGPTFTMAFNVVLTDSLGNQTTYSSSPFGGSWQLTSGQGSGCSTCTTRGNIQTQYDGNGNPGWTTDANGNTVGFQFNSSNEMVMQATPVNAGAIATTTYTYNSFGEVLTAKDPLGNTTTNAYDGYGNLTSVTTPAPNNSTTASVTSFAYNSLGELTSITDPLSNVTTITYNSVGLIATITDAQSNVTTYGYDSHGNRTSVTDALSHQTTFTYDAMDRLTKITYPDSTTTQFAYDYRGRRTSVTDQNGKATSYAYDDADRLTSVTDAASNVTQYGYDTENNLTSITDANGHETMFTYDAFGRVTQTSFPSTKIETYGYDANNNLTSKTDRNGHTIQYGYDQMNRLTQKTYPDSTSVNYTYDLDSRLTQVVDSTGTYQFTFDNMGRLTGTTTNYAFLTSRNFTTSYSYDKASNRTGFTDPESGSTAYVYDTLNRLQTLTPPSAFTSGAFGFSYDALSRRTQMTRPNSVNSVYAYDQLSHLTSVLHQLSGSTIDGAAYTLDNAGNRTAKTDEMAGVTSNYSHDAIYELTQVTQGTNTMESYTYDVGGNRLSSLGVSPYNVNVSNELTSTPNDGYTYDYNGNTTSKTDSTGTANYAWDFENRLTSVTLPGSGGTVIFKYDPFGRRIYKSSSAGVLVFVYDGDNLIEQTNSSGTAVSRYAHGLNIDEPLAMLSGATTNFYEADGLGSITSLSSSAGSLTQTYAFDSFGKQTNSSGTVTNPFQYTAREWDSETGLYYYRARYYDPNAGRFLSEDRVRFRAGSNFYRYAQNNASLFSDPSGNQTTGGRTTCIQVNANGGGGEVPCAPDICIKITFSGSMEVPCIDPGGAMTCINDDSYCRIPTTLDPPTPRGEDPSLMVLNRFIQCLQEEIEENFKIQAEFDNEMLIWQQGVAGASVGLNGLEVGLERLGFETLAESVPYVDFGLLGYHLIEGVKANIEAGRKLDEAKQRACSCEQRALNQ